MARRPPQFTLNVCDARHINIAHGNQARTKFELLFEKLSYLTPESITGAGASPWAVSFLVARLG
jgi:hypothetical protein